ncbi:ABC-three component system protein [Clostridium saccharobutylicum]|uniref:ABC-three component systems C-terminal domain-containing protein n=1 Tax=Clostridium saccharobutylicum DSM 13864 TaxID=1345695 RepID=U5MN53_CLOSA|nr:ABC-three component system protein [Clostridium saccharobutylicum]AGX41923.1 hypothetical protein CLSA_c09110 [Clostridium saccharobutylicum DSM 13864]AQR89200.1 hypothetical protein CLOSC_08970 [Clostridium saccharobutylicum]AQR99101.1 hypothetical protein CSACC_09040 [Clostridium saccharobutylicum]AQS08825.1 hypothetical protein CLOBY_09380 [Clostridium saccharobutylicum]AQS13089.1 hypothetical protein CLOSACC_09040 [Clostridium saccharobutylicum]
MLFSEFAYIMYKHCGGTFHMYEYFLLLIDTIMEDAKTPEDLKKVDTNSYNPFARLKPDTLDRLFHGTNPINQKKMRTVKSLINKQKFNDYVNKSRFDAQIGIAKEIKKRIPSFDDDDIGDSCAELFIQIIDDIIDGHETSSPVITATPPVNPKIKEVPATTVYFDDSDGKLHIGNTTISLPKELQPPSDIAPEEDIYVRKLLIAYADAMKSGLLTKENLESLPIKYQRNFKEQRINYYSAERINRFVRESIVNGEEQFIKWKSDTYDYISDTLWDDYDDGYRRLISVLKKVIDSSTTSIVDNFKNLIGPKEKKGVCHLLADDGTINWVIENE